MPLTRPQTREFQAFTANLEYARKMVTAGRSLDAFKSPIIDISDFYRAAWVQAVSAIDHWFHEELYRRVAELAAENTVGMPHQLTRFELPLSMVEEVRHGQRTLSEAVCDHVKAKWASASLQNPRKISEAFRLVTEEDVWAKAAVQLNTWNRGRTSMTAKDVKKQLADIAERRNKIAHEADLLGEDDLITRRPLTAAEVTDTVDRVERIAVAIAHILD